MLSSALTGKKISSTSSTLNYFYPNDHGLYFSKNIGPNHAEVVQK
jgi:hypothetical protein